MRPAAPFYRRAPTAVLTALSLAAAVAARSMAPPAVAPESSRRPADHVVIVSIDGLDPAALLFVEPVEGYMLSQGFEGDAVLVPATSRGQHGYLPEQPLMGTGLIASGAGLRQGVVMPVARQVDIAPTVARLLGVEMKEVEGATMVGLLEASAVREVGR